MLAISISANLLKVDLWKPVVITVLLVVTPSPAENNLKFNLILMVINVFVKPGMQQVEHLNHEQQLLK